MSANIMAMITPDRPSDRKTAGRGGADAGRLGRLEGQPERGEESRGQDGAGDGVAAGDGAEAGEAGEGGEGALSTTDLQTLLDAEWERAKQGDGW